MCLPAVREAFKPGLADGKSARLKGDRQASSRVVYRVPEPDRPGIQALSVSQRDQMRAESFQQASPTV